MQEREYNEAIKAKIKLFTPDVFLVYKGAFVQPETLTYAKQHNCRLVLFYPDVSMTFHGTNIPRSIPLYDLICTTKTFGITDLSAKFGVKSAVFIPHGFDPDIHRPLPVSDDDRKHFGCDVSFIGTWSPKKEKWLTFLYEKMPDISLKIWGDQWNRVTTPALKSVIQGRPVTGDLYAMAIQCSVINLGILSEQVAGASSGDLITSRTFHIPGAGGFMLHERNEESVLYFKENEEAAFFEGPEELVQKVEVYLKDNEQRKRIQAAGHARAVQDHSLDARAKKIISLVK